jgi:hypothetical protein
LFHDLIKHLPKKEMSLIVGPRQAGKTTLMLQLKDYLDQKGKKTLFLSQDFERDFPHFASQTALLARIGLEFGKSDGYVFLDEIQRKENAGLFLKGLYDLQTPYKFIVSGSGSMELKEKVHESLAGRKRLFELPTVSLKEFINFKTKYKYEDRLAQFFQVSQEEGRRFLMEYLNFGGYPRVILEEALEEKAMMINDIYRSYIEKDIAYLLRVDRVDAFGNLIRLLSGQTGQLINFNELSATLGISIQTVKNYIAYAEKTFIIKRITPYFQNLRKEISKSPIMYFCDIGMRNFAVRQFGRYEMLSELGFVFQNCVCRLLMDNKTRDGAGDVHFWRSKDKAEVDFVINQGDGVLPVEVNCKELKGKEIGRSLRGFINKYHPAQAWIVNLSLQEEEQIGKTKVMFRPFYELL